MNEIQTLLAEFVEIVRAIGELIILFVPLPWRLSLLFLFGYLIVLFGWRLILQVIRLLAYITLWIVELIAGILLWPEYQITRQVRRLGGGPLWGTYLYGAIVSSLAFWPDGRRFINLDREAALVFLVLAVYHYLITDWHLVCAPLFTGHHSDLLC